MPYFGSDCGKRDCQQIAQAFGRVLDARPTVTAADCAVEQQQISQFNEHAGGLGHLLMMAQGGWIDHKETVANLQLFSKEVLPRLAELN